MKKKPKKLTENKIESLSEVMARRHPAPAPTPLAKPPPVEEISISPEHANDLALAHERVEHARTVLVLRNKELNEAYLRVANNYNDGGKYVVLAPIDTDKRILRRALRG